jgi:hypothetical protein
MSEFYVSVAASSYKAHSSLQLPQRITQALSRLVPIVHLPDSHSAYKYGYSMQQSRCKLPRSASTLNALKGSISPGFPPKRPVNKFECTALIKTIRI